MFQPLQHTKGLYIDGHEQPDVVQYREMFLSKLLDLEWKHLPLPEVDSPVPSENLGDKKQLVISHHDESIFHTNDDQMRMWGEPDTHVIRPKSRRAGLMVSDFVEKDT